MAMSQRSTKKQLISSQKSNINTIWSQSYLFDVENIVLPRFSVNETRLHCIEIFFVKHFSWKTLWVRRILLEIYCS